MDLPADDPALEGLLEHADWLRGLARAMVLDPGRADDLVQEAWLAALRQPPDPAAARSWFRTVLRNAHRSQLRREAARDLREREVARPEALPEADATLARARALREVLDAATDLDEPYRSAILLRYSDGLSPTAIAARLDVPLDTVKTRLKRGLTRLRQRMDQRRGERGAWSALLLPTLFEPAEVLGLARGELLVLDGTLTPSSAAAATAGAGAGLAGLSATGLAGLGVAAALLATLWVGLWSAGPDGAEFDAPLAPSSADLPTDRLPALRLVAGGGTRSEAAGPAGGSRAFTPLTPALPGRPGWRGTVRDEHGPRVGARVELRDGEGALLGAVSTDALGRWALTFEEPEVRKPLVHGERVERLDRGRPPRGWLHIQVLDRGGAAPEDLAPGVAGDVAAGAPEESAVPAPRGSHAGSRSEILPAWPPAVVDLELRPAFEQVVEVVDEATGEPLAGLRVEARPALPQVLAPRVPTWFDEARTDAQGRAVVRVPGKQAVRLGVPGGQRVLPHEQEHLAQPSGEPVRLAVRLHATRLTLALVDATSGLTLVDGTVERLSVPAGASPRETPEAVALAGHGGEFELVRDPGDPAWSLRVAAPGFDARLVHLTGDPGPRVEVPVWPTRHAEVRVTRAGRAVRGELRYSCGLDVHTPFPTRVPEWLQDLHGHGSVALDARGRARLPVGNRVRGADGVARGHWCRLEVQEPGRDPVPVQVPFRQAAPFHVELAPPSVRVAYRLEDADGAPLAHTPVRADAFGSADATRLLPRAWSPDGRALTRAEHRATAVDRWPGPEEPLAPGLARTDGDGRLTLTVPRGSSLFLEVPGGSLAVPARELPSDGAPGAGASITELALESRDLELHGVVVGADGRPAPEALLFGTTLCFVSLDRPGRAALVHLEPDGTFHGDGFDGGRWSLRSDDFEARVVRGGELGVELTLPPVWTLDLELRDASGAPLRWEGAARAWLHVRGEDGRSRKELRPLAPHHRQRLRRARVAPERLEVRVPGYASRVVDLRWTSDTQELVLELEPRWTGSAPNGEGAESAPDGDGGGTGPDEAADPDPAGAGSGSD